MKKLLNLQVILSILLMSMLGQGQGISVGEASLKPVETPQTTHTISLVAIGDILSHMTVVRSGLQADGTYNYNHIFDNVRSDIASADIAVVNQEIVLAGTPAEASGYPVFNAPYQIADAESNAGFDVILHATNHIMDQGVAGIDRCMTYWETNFPAMLVAGVNRSEEDRNAIDIIERDGIKVAILNYTYGMNGFTLPADKPYLVNIIDDQRIISDIKRAKGMADIVAVFPHWGIEYQHVATAEQQRLAQLMADSGADVIIGTHPHVLENIEWLTGKDGNQTICYYSLGNFISTQLRTDTMLGGMAKIDITKTGDKVEITSAKLMPVATYYNRGMGVADTYKLSEYPESLIATHGILSDVPNFSLEKLNELAIDIVGETWLVDN